MLNTPLAEKLRPKELSEVVGQKHLLGKGKPITVLLDKGNLVSLIFWGPPGTGKTTIAKLLADQTNSEFISFSAVGGSVKELREIIAKALSRRDLFQKQTIVFIDELHRFNKAQQDSLLHAVEEGIITMIGATTENPSFYINAPLLSRSRVFKLDSLSEKDLEILLNRVKEHYPKHKFDKDAEQYILQQSHGDARAMLNTLELLLSLTDKVTIKVVENALQKQSVYYDKKGDSHYDTISAFIKSMRGGDADATLHYLARMIKAGEDPMFIARRMLIFASEDIGNARPTALVLATSCMQAVSMIGMPESQLILAQTSTYLATCPKSIASTEGIFSALSDLEKFGPDEIPLHLRNAPTSLMESFGYGKGHVRYPWKEELKGRKIKQDYLPNKYKNKRYYESV